MTIPIDYPDLLDAHADLERELQQAREDLKEARKYLEHYRNCLKYDGWHSLVETGLGCTCGLSAFLFKLDSEGLV